VVTQSNAHILTSEAGAPAVLSGLLVQPLEGDAKPPLAAWEQAAAQKSDPLKPPVVVVALENTHNRSGGVALDPDYTDKVIAIARRQDLRAHLDGARLLNAAVTTRQEPARLARGFDTVSFSLNKSLGAPLGAVLAGSKTRIAEAQRWRQRLGGGIRPTAIVAAAALAALEDWRSHIAEDHQRARRLARALAGLRHGTVEPDPQTNIVLLRLDEASVDAEKFCHALADAGVLALPFGPGRIRFITYRGITDADIDRAAAIIIEVISRTAEAGRNPQRRSAL
jgi:threonine aldolase